MCISCIYVCMYIKNLKIQQLNITKKTKKDCKKEA